MSSHIIFSQARRHLPGGLTPEATANYKWKKKIDWLCKFNGRLYIRVEKMRAWARVQGREVSQEFEQQVEKFGCRMEEQG